MNNIISKIFYYMPFFLFEMTENNINYVIKGGKAIDILTQTDIYSTDTDWDIVVPNKKIQEFMIRNFINFMTINIPDFNIDLITYNSLISNVEKNENFKIKNLLYDNNDIMDLIIQPINHIIYNNIIQINNINVVSYDYAIKDNFKTMRDRHKDLLYNGFIEQNNLFYNNKLEIDVKKTLKTVDKLYEKQLYNNYIENIKSLKNELKNKEITDTEYNEDINEYKTKYINDFYDLKHNNNINNQLLKQFNKYNRTRKRKNSLLNNKYSTLKTLKSKNRKYKSY